MEKLDGMTDEQFEELQRKMLEDKVRLEKGRIYFLRRMPLAEIVDVLERRGWKCAQAEEQGKKAKRLEENPHRGNTHLTYEKVLLCYYFDKGFQDTHPNP